MDGVLNKHAWQFLAPPRTKFWLHPDKGNDIWASMFKIKYIDTLYLSQIRVWYSFNIGMSQIKSFRSFTEHNQRSKTHDWKQIFLFFFQNGIPNWPMNAVSIREAIGSAASAMAAGNAIRSISNPSASILKTSLEAIAEKQAQDWETYNFLWLIHLRVRLTKKLKKYWEFYWFLWEVRQRDECFGEMLYYFLSFPWNKYLLAAGMKTIP